MTEVNGSDKSKPELIITGFSGGMHTPDGLDVKFDLSFNFGMSQSAAEVLFNAVQEALATVFSAMIP